MYNLRYSKNALKQFKKLSKDIRERLVLALERCRIRPYSHVQKVVGSTSFRLRVGDYRVIMDIINDELVILIIKIAHRKKVYKA